MLSVVAVTSTRGKEHRKKTSSMQSNILTIG
jgi:hypothetical protein